MPTHSDKSELRSGAINLVQPLILSFLSKENIPLTQSIGFYGKENYSYIDTQTQTHIDTHTQCYLCVCICKRSSGNDS